MDREIGYRRWVVPEPIAVFLLVHGIGAHNERWDSLGSFFAGRRISSYAIDCPKPEDYYDSILGLRGRIVGENPGKKIFLIGESLGAIVSFLLVSRRPGLFAGLVCFSPAFRSRLKLPAMDYLKILALLVYRPDKEFRLPFDSAMCTRDAAYRAKMDADKRESRLASSRSIAGIFFYQIAASISAGKFASPVLFLVAGDDKIADPDASAAVFKRIRARDKTFIGYPGMYHSLSVELGKEKVFDDLYRWIEKRI
ncbi:MAG: alpha/beta fold hydrolase [Candidatus Omnitrophota bacterium]